MLYHAIMFNEGDPIQILKEHPELLRQEDNFYRTPLYYAISKGNVNLVKYMSAIDKDKLYHWDVEGNTPLHYAIANEQYEIAVYIAKTNYNLITEENNKCITPMDMANPELRHEFYKILDLNKAPKPKQLEPSKISDPSLLLWSHNYTSTLHITSDYYKRSQNGKSGKTIK